MKTRFHRAGFQKGVSLVELMVALVIGMVLIGGAVTVYVQSRNSYGVNETVARLQENARFALSIIEPDIRMSNYWGLVKGAGLVTQQAAQTVASVGPPTTCGQNFARDLLLNLEAGNNEYDVGCPEAAGGAVDSSDTLTIRRASTVVEAGPAANRLQICSTRLMGRLVDDGSACTAAPAGSVNNLVVNTYYVASESDQGAGVPALRRHVLIDGPAFEDQEIVAGVEDMQVQFGIDPTGTNGEAQSYVDPDAVPVDSQVVSVRVWLLVRAEQQEQGFVDGRTYEYGDRNADNGTTDDLDDAAAATLAYAPDDGFRRILVSRTIRIRNALGT
jgi:type IV pilus assembly protein PilW